jgi:hypothetical protein
MTTPMFSTTTDDARFYEWPLMEGTHFPSVTTVIKQGIPKPILQTWAIKKTARLAMDEFATLTEFMEAINAAHS